MRLIDADAVRDDFANTVYLECANDKDNSRANRIIGAFDDLPTIDAEPVRHGRWIERYSPGGVRLCECSVCGTSAISQIDDTWGYVIDYYETDFCPNCGAKMDGGESDQ